MVTKVEHIGIAVTSIEEVRQLYRDVFGVEVSTVETEEEQGVKIAWAVLGNTRIELLEPTNPTGALARFLESRGEGIHHLAIEVKDIQEELKRLKEKGLPLVDEKPREGSGGTKIAFLHPRGTRRVLIELVEH